MSLVRFVTSRQSGFGADNPRGYWASGVQGSQPSTDSPRDTADQFRDRTIGCSRFLFVEKANNVL
jgi:hypothetical protein